MSPDEVQRVGQGLCCLLKNPQPACTTLVSSTKLAPIVFPAIRPQFSYLTNVISRNFHGNFATSTLIQQPPLVKRGLLIPKPSLETQFSRRNLIKFSLKSGKRKTVKAVLKRFYRLDWGMWIRTKCGRNKKLYKKSANRKRRLRQHVFTNAKQSYLLDKMVTNYWRKPKFYPDDPYNPYHKREEFPLTRKLPRPPHL